MGESFGELRSYVDGVETAAGRVHGVDQRR
jgi:hypothetical protein